MKKQLSSVIKKLEIIDIGIKGLLGLRCKECKEITLIDIPPCIKRYYLTQKIT